MSKVKREYSTYFTHTAKYAFEEEKVKRDFPFLFGIEDEDDDEGEYTSDSLVRDTIKAINKEIIEQHAHSGSVPLCAQKCVDMELKIINLPFEVDTNAILIAKPSADNMPRVEEFVTNYAVEHTDCLNDDLYICYQQLGDTIQVVGTFCFNRNMPPIENIGNNINCNELSYLITDLRILNHECLLRVFSVILPLLVNRNDNNDEGIWFSYQGSINARRIENLFKTCREYYFQNESEYFASRIVEIEQQIEENNQRINALLNH